MDNEDNSKELDVLEEDVIRASESLGDSIRHDEYLELLRKKLKKWRLAALSSVIVFLMVILYACGSIKHSDTIVPKDTQKPEPTETVTPPVDKEAESIEIYEYVIKAAGVTPDFTDDLMIPDLAGLKGNDEAIDAYGKSYSVDWVMEQGDDSFTAERQAGEKYFIGDKPFSFTNGGINYNIYGEVLAYMPSKTYEAFISVSPVENSMRSRGVSSIAVVLPESTSEEDISSGVSAFLEKFKSLNWRLSGEQDVEYQEFFEGRRQWDILDRSQEDMAQMLGDCFGVQGYRLTSNPEDGDIHFLGSGDKTTVDSEYIKDGDKIVFISLERFSMNSDRTAAFYSKYLQGGDLKVFSSQDSLDAYLSEAQGK